MKLIVTLVVTFVFAGIALADYQVVSTIDAPDTNISGLGFGNGSLWAVDGTTEYAYEVDPATGSVINSWYIENVARVPSGCTFANNTLYIACGTPPNLTGSYCYKYTSAGAYSGMFSLDCWGSDLDQEVTGLATGNSKIYGAGVDTQTMKECLEIYSYTGAIQSGPEFMLELGIDFYDIAYFDNMWWYACNDTEFPVRIYDGNGTQVGAIPSSVITAAHGMTFDAEGYLWVSDMNTDEIHKLDVDVTSLTRSTWGSIKATF